MRVASRGIRRWFFGGQLNGTAFAAHCLIATDKFGGVALTDIVAVTVKPFAGLTDASREQVIQQCLLRFALTIVAEITGEPSRLDQVKPVLGDAPRHVGRAAVDAA